MELRWRKATEKEVVFTKTSRRLFSKEYGIGPRDFKLFWANTVTQKSQEIGVAYEEAEKLFLANNPGFTMLAKEIFLKPWVAYEESDPKIQALTQSLMLPEVDQFQLQDFIKQFSKMSDYEKDILENAFADIDEVEHSGNHVKKCLYLYKSLTQTEKDLFWDQNRK